MVLPNPLLIPSHTRATLQGVSRFGFAAARDLAVLTDEEIDNVRRHLRILTRYGYARGAYFGIPHLRTEKRWWAPNRGYKALIASVADETEFANSIREDRAGLGYMVLRPDVAALITRVVSLIVPHVEEAFPVWPNWFAEDPLDCLIEFGGERYLFILYADQALRRPRVWKRLKKIRALFNGSCYLTLVLTTTTRDRIVVTNQLQNLKLPGAVGTIAHVLNPRLKGFWSTEAKKWWGLADIAANIRPLTYRATGERVTVHDIELPFASARSTPVRGIVTAAALNIPPLAKRILDLLHLWPKIPRTSLHSILVVRSSQVSDLLRILQEHGLVRAEWDRGVKYSLLTQTGIKYVADRGRAETRELYKLLSPEYIEDERGRTVRKGTLLRSIESEPDHHDLVMEALGSLASGIAGQTPWTVEGMIPPRRGRLAFTTGEWAGRARSAIASWYSPSRKHPEVKENSRHIIFPDATIEVSAASTLYQLLLEIERSATSITEWRDRLQSYALSSLVRPSFSMPLFIVDSTEKERALLQVQWRWTMLADPEVWPVACTTVARLRSQTAVGKIWRVDGQTSDLFALVDLPAAMSRGQSG